MLRKTIRTRAEIRAFALLALVAGPFGCAATLPGEPVGPAPATEEARPAPEPERPTETSGGPARELAGAESIVRLCDTLRDEDGILFEGNEVARSRARA